MEKSFLKILANNLILKEKIKTTEARAAAARPFTERLISRGKKQNLPAYRFLLKSVSRPAADKIYYELASRYRERTGGCLRIIKHSRRRKSDGARMVDIEFV